MRSHRFTPARGAAGAVIASAMLAFAAPAAAVPIENSGHHRAGPPVVPSPTIVKETVIRPGGGTDALVFVAIGAAAIVGMLGAGITGARVATRTASAPRPTDERPTLEVRAG
jgi:hypothetical protein